MTGQSAGQFGHIGLSYAAQDKGTAQHLATYLRARGYAPFRIGPTKSTPEPKVHLQRAVIACDCAILLLSPDAMRSGRVRLEHQLLRRAGKPIIPIIVAAFPPHLPAPAANAIDATDGLDTALPAILWRLAALDGRASRSAPLITWVQGAQLVTAIAMLFSAILVAYLVANPMPDLNSLNDYDVSAFSLPVEGTNTHPPTVTNTPHTATADDSGSDASSVTDAVVTQAAPVEPTPTQTTAVPRLDAINTPTSGVTATGTASPTATTAPPQAAIIASSVIGVAPFSVRFTSASSGDITGYRWDFDGNTVTDAVMANPSDYVYATAGTYVVNLVVAGAGGFDDASIVITVLQPTATARPPTAIPLNTPALPAPLPTVAQPTSPQADVIAASATPVPTRVQVTAPVASFAPSTNRGLAPLAVRFSDTSTGSISAYRWDFNNDGTIDSTAASPTFTFTQAGEYIVSLVVEGPGGVSERASTSIFVLPPDLDADDDGFNDVDECAPDDPNIYPGAPDVPGDGIDQDCDGMDAVSPTQAANTDS